MPIHTNFPTKPHKISHSFTHTISISNEMTIFSPNPSKFIEDALFCSDPFSLSYSDPDQKWIIRDHLLCLLRDFPSLHPSVAVFTHNDGTEAKLLNAAGELYVTAHAPPVPLTIWLHELYPHMPPIVYINIESSPYPIYDNYPFADPSSGAATSAYITNWHFAKSSLSGLAHNLIKLFRHNHPFYYTGGSGRSAHPFAASRIEATDRLTCSIYYDAAEIAAATAEEIENLAVVQARLRKRAEILAAATSELENERRCLKLKVDELYGESDRVMNWLKVYGSDPGIVAIDEAFEGVDERSEMAMELAAADLAAEDLMYGLEKAVEGEVFGFDVYMKQVRVLAREQYFCRDKLGKIQNPMGYFPGFV